jgi:hypothetical protein
MQCECASAIVAEMADWVGLGGGNSGCCGNAAHLYGFHLPAFKINITDYSRRYETPLPFNMSWACAGDFHHGGDAQLRAKHAQVLKRLMAGAYPMICEFIGQPVAGGAVLYWAPWHGVATLQEYTGAGHTTWSHISWWRSRANERAHLWTPAPTPAPIPRKRRPGKVPPKYAGRLLRYGPEYSIQVRIWQAQMRARGWSIKADGYFGQATLKIVRQFQREKSLDVDGVIGTKTWRTAWTARIT